MGRGTRGGPSHPQNASVSKTRRAIPLKVADRIEVNYMNKGIWKPATYQRQGHAVIYDDSFKESWVLKEQIRPLGSAWAAQCLAARAPRLRKGKHPVARRLAANSQVMEQIPSDTPTFSNQACEIPHRPRRRLVELAYCVLVGLNVLLMCCLAVGICFVCRQGDSKQHRPRQHIRW